MKVGYKTQVDDEFKSIQLPNDDSSPILISVAQTKDNNMENKFLVWHIEGGLGKNIAATALIPSIVKKYKSRKLIIVASYPEVFLNHPDVHRVYRVGLTAYFYDDYILSSLSKMIINRDLSKIKLKNEKFKFKKEENK